MITSDILLFVRVAETSSFKEAARQLNISASQASKRIASIEDEHGARLFYRTPRNISLTSAGETLLEYYRRIHQMIEESRAAIGQLSKPCGRLRFSVPTCLGAVLLPKLHADFAKRYPQILIDAHTSESFVDVVAGGYDVVIRVAQRLTDSALIARRLATSPLVVAAAPAYLEKHGRPTDVAELARHQCIGLETAKPCVTRWHFTTPEGAVSIPVNLTTVTSSNLALVLAARSGLGLIYVPHAVIANELRQDTLRAVLPDFCKGVEWGVFAVHSGKTPTSNAAVFIDFVRTLLPELELIDRWQPLLPPAIDRRKQPIEPPDRVSATALAPAGKRNRPEASFPGRHTTSATSDSVVAAAASVNEASTPQVFGV
jgi:DNA-binding transcriptional LysR family regulator